MNARVGQPIMFIVKEGERRESVTIAVDGSLEDWVDLSYRLAPISRWLITRTQQLGFLDVDLHAANVSAAADPSDLPDADKESAAIAFTKWQFVSELWVLAAYELVRYAEANLGSLGKTTQELRRQWRELKRGYEDVRIPLAKQRSSANTEDREIDVAYPVVPGDRGAGWLIGESVVWRDELAVQLRAAIRACPPIQHGPVVQVSST